MTFDDAPDVLTVRETAELLRLGLNQVYEAVNEGTIPARRIGRSWRVPKAALKQWLVGEENEEADGVVVPLDGPRAG